MIVGGEDRAEGISLFKECKGWKSEIRRLWREGRGWKPPGKRRRMPERGDLLEGREESLRVGSRRERTPNQVMLLMSEFLGYSFSHGNTHGGDRERDLDEVGGTPNGLGESGKGLRNLLLSFLLWCCFILSAMFCPFRHLSVVPFCFSCLFCLLLIREASIWLSDRKVPRLAYCITD